ncbi:Clavaminate synthase-like protein [Ophiobolus disseminans]|uniref:Clavaminate synthase-like protein n=1 Tax=Ophiobolus disseminans TaxID=1469910 RepID=A0A6A7AE78_9PLEO|nr:Clavaminate synthase-like protein [Ophiobolus disseminans]
MSEVEATLDAYRSRLAGGGNSSPFLNPTPDQGGRYEKPIATAHNEGLPIIDISAYLDAESTEESRQTTAKAINAACVNYGFFYLTGHGIPVPILDQVISLARDFFALPLEEKNKIKRFDAGGPEGGDGARGYQGLGENVTGGLQDMQEAVDWYREWPADKKDLKDGRVKTLQGPNLWPAVPQNLTPVYTDYISRVQRIGKALVHAMGAALELGAPIAGANKATQDENIFVRNCEDSFWVMRMINYPPLAATHTPHSTTASTSGKSESEADAESFSCGAHTDYGCVTLLHTDATPGALHVRLKDGTWLAADPVPGAFVVNIGDMIERWTNGLWKSTLHRVIHRGEAARVSVPFFYEPNFEAMVKPLAKCVQRSGGKEMHAGSTYGEHLQTKVFSNFYYSKRTDW